MRSRITVVLLILPALVTCTALAADVDRPTHTAALAQINAFLNSHDLYGTNELWTITNLSYQNGYQVDANNYVVVANHTRVFKLSATCVSAMAAAQGGGVAQGITNLVLAFDWGNFKPGDSRDEAGSYRFLRTENGWILLRPEGGFALVAKHVASGAAESAPCPVNEQYPQFASNTKMKSDYDFRGARGTCVIKTDTPIKDRGPVLDGRFPLDDPHDFVTLPPGVCSELRPDNNWTLPRRVLEQTPAVRASDAAAPRVAAAPAAATVSSGPSASGLAQYIAYTHSITDADFLVHTAVPTIFGSAYDRSVGRACALPAGSSVYLKNINDKNASVSIAIPDSTCTGNKAVHGGTLTANDSILGPQVLQDPATLTALHRLHASWEEYGRKVGLSPAKDANAVR